MNLQEQKNKFDGSGYFRVLVDFDRQIQGAAEILGQTILHPAIQSIRQQIQSIRHIVICGMGGSAIAGDFVKNLFSDNLPVPIIVCRDYEVPRFVSGQTLVIISSYSGNTEETISAFRDALGQKAVILSLSTGGMIADLSQQRNLQNIFLPSGLQPRQAIGYSFTILTGLIHYLYYGHVAQADISEAENYLKKKKMVWSDAGSSNPLVRAAEAMTHLPVMIYASEPMFAAALRLKGQISENAKLLAFANTIVEMNHNEIVGWQTIDADSINNFSAILLRDTKDHPQVIKRFEIIQDILGKKSQVFVFQSEGRSKFTRFVSLIYLGDWLSYYLALVREQDPTPVDIIGYLKQQLAGLQ